MAFKRDRNVTTANLAIGIVGQGILATKDTVDYNDLLNQPTLGTAASKNIEFFATAAQGTLAGTALQPGDGLASLDSTANTKLAGIATGAEVNINADWTAISGDSQILNKPTLFSGAYEDLTGKPVIPTNNNQLTNGKGYITSYTETDPTISTWAKAATKPSYSYSEITGTKPPTTADQTSTHNAASATKLATVRTIAGHSFDGTQNVTISASDVGAVGTGSNALVSSLTAGYTGSGNVVLKSGGTSHTGFIEFHDPTGTRLGYIGYSPTGGYGINIRNEAGTGVAVYGAVTMSSSLVVGANISAASGAFSGPVTASNLSGTNTGDQDLSGLVEAQAGYAGSDANVITTTGAFQITSPSTNTADGEWQTILSASPAAGANKAFQIAYSWNANNYYIRNEYNGWRAWARIWTDQDLDPSTFMPKSGGTFTGLTVYTGVYSSSNTPSFGGLGIAWNIQAPMGEADFISGNGGAQGHGFNFYSRNSNGSLSNIATMNVTDGIYANGANAAIGMRDRTYGVHWQWYVDSGLAHFGFTGADMFTLSNVGNAYFAGSIKAAGEIQSTSANAFRCVYGNYGAFWRNDGGNLYLLLTNSGDAYGSWNGLRPFQVTLATGLVSMSNGLNVSGGLTGDSVTDTSDARYKSNVRPLNNSWVEDLNPVRFYNEKTGREDIGLIAQEAREVFPEIVHEDADGYLSLAYQRLVAPLIVEVQSLRKRVAELEKQA